MNYSSAQQSQNAFGSALGMMGALGQSQAGAANYFDPRPITPETGEQRAERIAFANTWEIEKSKKRRKAKLYARASRRCWGGAVGMLATSVFLFSLNVSFHNTDYNSIVGSALMWGLLVLTLGATFILASYGMVNFYAFERCRI